MVIIAIHIVSHCIHKDQFEEVWYQVKCLKFKVPKVPKVKGTKMTITCFGPVFIGLKMGFLYYELSSLRSSPLKERGEYWNVENPALRGWNNGI